MNNFSPFIPDGRHGVAILAGMYFCFAASAAFAVVNDKCDAIMSFDFDPGTTVSDGTQVTLTEEVKVDSVGSGAQDCGLAVGDYVDEGNARIKAVTWGDGGGGRPCGDLGQSFCTAGTVGDACVDDADCDTAQGANDGECTEVVLTTLVQETGANFDGLLDAVVDTTGLGYGVFGFQASYGPTGQFEDSPNGSPTICTDLTVEEPGGGPCEGATISIDRASGPGEPGAPGGPYEWSFRVTVHACEDLYGVTAQGGTNGWAQLVNRSEDSLHPSTGTAEIRKANRKTDVILWTIGDMLAGDTETLDVDLEGSLKRAPDCDERFLSGPWSALFSLDGFAFEKTDYTGRVSIFTNSNGVEGDCN